MFRSTAIRFVLAASLVLPGSAALAQQYNTSRFLGAGQANAVNRGLAQSNLRRNGNNAADQAEGPQSEACGSLNTGNVIVPEGARTPREVTVVIKGDVTNVAKFGSCR